MDNAQWMTHNDGWRTKSYHIIQAATPIHGNKGTKDGWCRYTSEHICTCIWTQSKRHLHVHKVIQIRNLVKTSKVQTSNELHSDLDNH